MKFNLIIISCILILIASLCDGKTVRFIRDLKTNSTATKEAPIAIKNSTESRPIAVAGIGRPSGESAAPRMPGNPNDGVASDGYRAQPGLSSWPSVQAGGPVPSGIPPGQPGVPGSLVGGYMPRPGVPGGSESWPSGGPAFPGSSQSGQMVGSGPGGWGTGIPGIYHPPSQHNFNTDGYKLCVKQKVVASNDITREIPICVLITIPEYIPSTYTVRRQF